MCVMAGCVLVVVVVMAFFVGCGCPTCCRVSGCYASYCICACQAGLVWCVWVVGVVVVNCIVVASI